MKKRLMALLALILAVVPSLPAKADVAYTPVMGKYQSTTFYIIMLGVAAIAFALVIYYIIRNRRN